MSHLDEFSIVFMDEFQVDVLFLNNRMIDVKAVINGINIDMTLIYGDRVFRKKEIKFRNLLPVLPPLNMVRGL